MWWCNVYIFKFSVSFNDREFNLSEKVFSLIFGLNGIGIILFSLLSKFLIKTRSIKFILFWGLLIQLFGILLLGIGYFLFLRI